MSCGTFWCIRFTAEGGAALIFAVKLAKNLEKVKKNFSSLKTFSSRFTTEKSEKFFGSNRPSVFFFCEHLLFERKIGKTSKNGHFEQMG